MLACLEILVSNTTCTVVILRCKGKRRKNPTCRSVFSNRSAFAFCHSFDLAWDEPSRQLAVLRKAYAACHRAMATPAIAAIETGGLSDAPPVD